MILNSRYYTWLIPYLEGTLDNKRRALLEARLAKDARLAAEAEALRWTMAHLRVTAAEPQANLAEASTPNVWPRVRARLEPVPQRTRLRPPQRLAWAAGLCAASALAVAFVIQQPPRQPIINEMHSSDVSAAHKDQITTKSAATAPTIRAVTSLPAPTQLASDQPAPVRSNPRLSNTKSDKFADPFAMRPPTVVQTPSLSASQNQWAFSQNQTAPKSATESRVSDNPEIQNLPIQTGSNQKSVLAYRAPGFAAPPTPSSPSPVQTFTGFAGSAGGSSNTAQNAPIATKAPTVSLGLNGNAATDNTAAIPKGLSHGFERTHNAHLFANRHVEASDNTLFGIAAPMPQMSNGIDVQQDQHSANPQNKAVIDGRQHIPGDNFDLLQRQFGKPGQEPIQRATAAQGLALAYAERGRMRPSLDYWQSALEITVTPPLYGSDSGSRFAAQVFQSVHDSDMLASLQANLERRRRQRPQDIVLGRLLAALYDFSGDAGLARGERQRVVRIGMASAEDWYELAAADEQAGDQAAATLAYRQALTAGPILNADHDAITRQRLQAADH